MIFELFEPAAQAYIGAIGVLDPQSIDYQVVECSFMHLAMNLEHFTRDVSTLF
jgi:hypothetical protein